MCHGFLSLLLNRQRLGETGLSLTFAEDLLDFFFMDHMGSLEPNHQGPLSCLVDQPYFYSILKDHHDDSRTKILKAVWESHYIALERTGSC